MKVANAIAVNGEVARIINYNSRLKLKNCQYSYGEEADLPNLKKNKFDVIIEGEELFIFDLTLGINNILNLRVVIEDVLEKKFLNIENILFDYKVIKITNKEIKVLIYCINGKNLCILNNKFYQKINSIKVLQLIYSEVYRKRLKKKDFLLLIKNNNKMYLLIIKNKILISNKIFSMEDNFWKIRLMEYIDDLNRINFIYSPIYIMKDRNEEGDYKETIEELSDKYEVRILS